MQDRHINVGIGSEIASTVTTQGQDGHLISLKIANHAVLILPLAILGFTAASALLPFAAAAAIRVNLR